MRKTAQKAAKIAQEAPKKGPGGSQNGPDSPPESPEEASQDPPKTTWERDPSKSPKTLKNQWFFNIFEPRNPPPTGPQTAGGGAVRGPVYLTQMKRKAVIFHVCSWWWLLVVVAADPIWDPIFLRISMQFH